ncbi:MAG: RimK/LysX family protein [Gammaproteobacteria bacterium]|nr:RimK/LysX family protein [Gammaproteobacteria bacterium]
MYISSLSTFGWGRKYLGGITFTLCLLNISSTLAADKQTIGWVEQVTINKNALKLKAKIDTGATTSSLHAKIIKNFKRDNQKWVQFRVINNAGEDIILDKKIIHTVKIKRKLALPLKRPVIKLGICLGKIYRELEVNLANRENFKYQMLIGRNYLEDYFLVDSSRMFTVSPACK